MSIRNVIASTTGAVTGSISALTDAGSLFTDWVQDERSVRSATRELSIERRVTSAFIDHAKWKDELSQKYSAEVLAEAKAMMKKKAIEF